jgi:hypothetical protein
LKEFVVWVPNFEEAANWVPNIERLLYWVLNFQISRWLRSFATDGVEQADGSACAVGRLRPAGRRNLRSRQCRCETRSVERQLETLPSPATVDVRSYGGESWARWPIQMAELGLRIRYEEMILRRRD